MRREWSHRNASGGGSIHGTYAEAVEAREAYLHRVDNRSPLEPPPPPSTGIWTRLVTEWEREGDS